MNTEVTGQKRERSTEEQAAVKKQKTVLDQFKNPPSMERLLSWATAGKLTAEEKKPLVTINATSSIADAIKVLADNKILSAPVVEDGLGFPSYRGFIDMFDILRVILKIYSKDKYTTVEEWWRDYTTNVTELQVKSSILKTTTVLTALGDTSSVYNAYEFDTPLSQILNDFQKGIHRVAVGKDGKLTSILSQSTVLRYLAKNVSHLSKYAKRETVMNIGIGTIGTGSLLKINYTTPTIEAFYMLYLNNKSALPIVDNEGTLLANLSISDLRGISTRNFASLLLPVLEFISCQVSEFRPPITVDISDPFETVLLKLAATKVHRVWVKNNAELAGVISLTDVMKIIPAAYNPKVDVAQWFS
mmetsp:Transcript_7993/g.8820  ORF Transcript_7993/g.8820 Transcript_7993/m.8820 type:complete len:359 (+) Transcript_7993:54-1130(+)